jgi:hypothetical protein
LYFSFEGIIKTKYEGVGGIISKLWYLFYLYPLSFYRQYRSLILELTSVVDEPGQLSWCSVILPIWRHWVQIHLSATYFNFCRVIMYSSNCIHTVSTAIHSVVWHWQALTDLRKNQQTGAGARGQIRLIDFEVMTLIY